MKIEIERESDGRWLADIPEFPGVTTYGPTPVKAVVNALQLALSVITDRIKHNEPVPKEWLDWSRE